MAPVLAGRDVIGRSRTGTGKTLAFGMPSVVRLVELAKQKGNCDTLPDGNIRMKRGRLPSMLVMCPTRELARQVEGELSEICRPLGLYTQVFHGGVSYDPQVREIVEVCNVYS
jgi:ATP-dependent RNA helicase DDX21